MISKMTVLIVDDEARNCRLLDAILQAEGYQTLLATSGTQALTLAATESPDVILLDLMMPDMDGFQVLQHLRENSHTRWIPVIITSALDDIVVRHRVISAGVADFISKPINRWELELRLRRLLQDREEPSTERGAEGENGH